MADTSSTHVIQYIGDIDSIFTKVKELTRINKLAADKMGADFGTAVNLIDQQISKLSQRTIQVPVVDAQGKKTGAVRDQLTDSREVTSIIQTQDGQLKKLVETQVRVDGGFKSLNLTISAYKKSLQETNKQEEVFIGSLNQVANSLANVDRINKQVIQNFGAAGIGAKQLGTSLTNVKTKEFIADGQKITQTTSTFDTQVKLANGTMKTLRDTVVSTNGAVKSVNSTFLTASTGAKTFGENLAFILKRAALTIPVWFLLRNSISSVFTTIRDGLQNLVAFDLALQKVKRNLQGTPSEIESNFKTLRSEITKFSLETGKSTEEISEAVKAFATIGFSFEDSLKGGIEATKLSILLFGDGAETANTFARAIKILEDTTVGAVSVQEQMAEAFALTAELEKTNQFNIKEVNESLIKFVPTAKSAGLSMRETLILLASLGTAGRTGSNAGTLLSSSFNELRGNLDKVAGSLGISVNPQLDTTFSLMTRVLDKSEELQKTDSLGAAQAKALAEVFGGQKGTKPVESLTALNKLFKENSKILPDVIKFNKEFNKVNDTLASNVRKLTNELKENGKAFVASLVGAEDFNESVKKINKGVKDSKPAIEGVGQTLNSIFSQPLTLVGAAALPGLLKTLFTQNIPAAIVFGGARTLAAIGAFLVKMRLGLIGGIPGLVATAGVILADALPKMWKRGIERSDQEAQNQFLKITQGLRGKLSKFDLNELIVGIQSGDIKLDANLNKDSIVQQLQAQLGQKLVIEKDLEVKAKSITFLSTGETQDLNKIIIDNQLEILKSQGASTSELLKQESLLNKQFRIHEDVNTVLSRQLSTQRAINEEKRLQNKLGSDSIKLFDIAQQQGVDVAKAIGDVLAGNTSFDTFIRRGGEAVNVFKTEFADVFKNQQAQQFFKGNRVSGVDTLTGGSRIPIQENLNFAPTRFNTAAALAQAQALNQIPTIRNEIQAQIQFSVDVKGLSFREAVKVMKEELSKEILNPESDISKSLEKHTETI